MSSARQEGFRLLYVRIFPLRARRGYLRYKLGMDLTRANALHALVLPGEDARAESLCISGGIHFAYEYSASGEVQRDTASISGKQFATPIEEDLRLMSVLW